MKTIPELRAELDKLKEKVDLIGAVVSLSRRLNDADYCFVSGMKREIVDLIVGVSREMTEAMRFTKEQVELAKTNPEIKESAVEVALCLARLISDMEKSATRLNDYLDIFDRRMEAQDKTS